MAPPRKPPAESAARLRQELAASQAEAAALRARLDEAERSSVHKSRFIRHVSHEFRTPLSSIIGFASLLESEGEEMDPAVRAEYLAVVLRNARHLLHVVDDLLNISKVEAGALEVTLAPVRAAEVAEAVITALEPQAFARGIVFRMDDRAGRAALADVGRLRQVLFNLLENAVKYSPEGGEVAVRVTDGAGEVRVEVSDRGPGISRTNQLRLFKEFSRVNPPGLRVRGAGLGLALSRMLTEAMGGSVGVSSIPGHGSTFWISLPAAAAGEAAAEAGVPAPAVARTRGEMVAVVDDDADIRAYATIVLRRAGYRAVADDGSPGVGARLAQAHPRLVLLDLHLVGRGGAEALAEMRGFTALESIPVLAFTAGALADPNPAGFDGKVVKPVEADVLVAYVDEALSRAPAPAEAPADEDDFLAPLRARFRTGLHDRLAAIERHAAAGDQEALRRELHKLRGAAAGYGFAELSRLGDAAEEAVRTRGGGPEVDALLARLREEVSAR
ncbi:MAG TPA: ATP-binding protein [Longimicrobium sp.]|uniref:ATP-binding response regulator n=1 Tax=Longimicrobium sp. TaxID=2029185 RepID=UPI002EDAE780